MLIDSVALNNNLNSSKTIAMKNNFILVAFILIGSVCLGQSSFKEIYDYGQYKSNWAMVQSNEGLFGFIDKKGNVVVPAIYKNIYDFGEMHEDWAVIQTVDKKFGFIDKKGNVVVEPVYLEIYDFGDEHPNWARVKLANGNYSFIDKSGKEVSFKGQIVSL